MGGESGGLHAGSLVSVEGGGGMGASAAVGAKGRKWNDETAVIHTHLLMCGCVDVATG